MIDNTTETLTTARGFRLAVDPNDPVITGSIRDSGVWEEAVAEAIDRHLLPGWTFLDLGAHVGYFSVIAGAKGNSVIAVEANPEYARLLAENVARNGNPPIEIWPVAVSDKPGIAHLTTDERYAAHPSAAYLGDAGIEVEAKRLTDILSSIRPEFIKADIEGLEYAVFKDSPEILDAAQVIVLEVGGAMCERAGATVSELLSLLREHRFDVTYIDGKPLDHQLTEMRGGQYTNLLARKLPEGVEIAPAETATLLLCAWRSVTAETMECIIAVRDRGWAYTVVRGDALITRSRGKAVSKWYKRAADDVFLMVDDDVVFSAEDAERVVALAREKRGIAVGAYPVKDASHLACRGFVGQHLRFGPDMPAVEIQYPATGFMAVHRDVITKMIETVPLTGNKEDDSAYWPLFSTFWQTGSDGGSEDLSEDYAFGERAIRLGFKTWLDQRVILYHIGDYAYSVYNLRRDCPSCKAKIDNAAAFCTWCGVPMEEA